MDIKILPADLTLFVCGVS